MTIRSVRAGAVRVGRLLASALSRRAGCAGAVLILVAIPGVGNAEETGPIPDPLPLEWCLERARISNPMLAEARAEADAAAQRVRPAGALEDPRLAYEASNVPTGAFDFDSTPLSGHQFGLRQKLPFPGLLTHREKAASSGAAAAELLVDDQRLATDAAVESAWAELGFSQQALVITDRNIELLRKLAATAESRYRVGAGLQQDVLRAHVELTALLQERLRRAEAVEQGAAELVALLDLPPDTRLPRTTALETTYAEPELGALLAALDQNSARLRSAEERVEQARLRVRVAELEGYPDVDLGVGYRIRTRVPGDPVDGEDFLSAGLTLRLPVNRAAWRARVAEHRSMLRSAEAELRSVRAMLGAQTRRAHAALRRASSEAELLETGLLPQARQSLEASRSAYAVGRIEFLSLLDSQVRLFDTELRLARASADKRRAFAALESASGGRLR